MATRTLSLHDSSSAGELMKAINPLLMLMSLAAGVTIILAFQSWVDFVITDLQGTDAEAATGLSDGWFVAGLAAVILAMIGGVIFTPKLAPVLLPAIALCAICILAIAGFDAITNWHASGVDAENSGVIVQAPGNPTAVPYVIAALAIVIAVLAAVARGLQLKADPHLMGDLTEHAEELAR